MVNIEEIKRELKESIAIYKKHKALDDLSLNQVNAFEIQLRQKMWGEPCPRCQIIMDGRVNPTVDHIIPESLLLQFGINPRKNLWVENLRVLCQRCNAFKANRLDFTAPETKQLLKELVDKC